MHKDRPQFSNIIYSFIETVRNYPENKALYIDGRYFTYRELYNTAYQIQKTIGDKNQQTIGIYASRSFIAYAGMLGIMMSGNIYVPLNPKFPKERNSRILKLCETDTLIIENDYISDCLKITSESKKSYQYIIADKRNQNDATEIENISYYTKENLPETIEWPTSLESDNLAYLLFTSGSTGTPKGVPITHLNLCTYINTIISLYTPTPKDRFTQLFDLTFDLSIHDIFVSLCSGSCLYIIPQKSVMAPAKFVKEHEITFWFSVPSVISFMSKFNMLKEGSFPTITNSLFCGEALTTNNANLWSKAAPNSLIENIYGPTEATIAFTRYPWTKESRSIKFDNGLVPIGTPFDGQYADVLSEKDKWADQNETGELLLSGSQLSPGYWNNESKTQKQFILLKDRDGIEKRWYRSGDLAKITEHGLIYLGRLDSQIKISGYRVELGDIENTIREYIHSSLVSAIAVPPEGEVSGIEVFVSDTTQSELSIKEHCKNELPAYMVPKKIHKIESFPLNANGKIDKNQLKSQIKEFYDK